uniref:Global nitrogen transcriptional regulator n=1 Tax=Polysiphonia sertularioides TaxID=945028 RepID=A0A1Z1MGD3_9FLOR|nr:global nitrogen transcriptional regulator [Polysiphonia sertularioides]
MKWIIFLARNRIPYYVYELSKEDKIVLNNVDDNKILIIISGITVITKIFRNEIKLPVAILEKDNIFISKQNQGRIYYEIKAISHTYIIIINKVLFKQKKIHNSPEIIKAHYDTVTKYEEIIMIMNQKSSTKRILLMILSIFVKFGYVNKNKITISFELSEKSLAILTNTSISTVNKTINNIKSITLNKKINTAIHTLTIKKAHLI